jgi:RNA polymerase sigma factor (sigma-70 family)
VLAPPHSEGPRELGPSDHALVAAVRRGDDRAFEALYARYHRRIAAYVLGMVKDHGRAEDITQEVFVSAVRRMRETERPIAFKAWVYEIARNACIDHYRRSRRAEEVSIDADEGLAPSDYGRLVGSGPTPDAAVAAKQDLDDLCGAFDGLSETHHRILVLRELEGLSYQEIGARMGMTRAAVESTLFRARRRLTEEYEDLISGARCLRVQAILAQLGAGALGARDSRRLAKHVAHCQPCRRQALVAGVDPAVLGRRPLRERVAGKVAALLPLPGLLRWRRGGGGGGDAGAGAGGWAAQLPLLSEHAGAGWGKLAAAATVVLAGVGAGVGEHARHASAAATPAAHERAAAGAASPLGHAPGSAVARGDGAADATARTRTRRTGSRADGGAERRARGAASATTPRPVDGAGTTSAGAPRTGTPSGGSGGPGGPGGSGGSGGVDPGRTTEQVKDAVGGGGTPRVELPVTAPPPVVGDAVRRVGDAASGVTGAVGGAAQPVVDGAVGAAGQVAGGATGAGSQVTDGAGAVLSP